MFDSKTILAAVCALGFTFGAPETSDAGLLSKLFGKDCCCDPCDTCCDPCGQHLHHHAYHGGCGCGHHHHHAYQPAGCGCGGHGYHHRYHNAYHPGAGCGCGHSSHAYSHAPSYHAPSYHHAPSSCGCGRTAGYPTPRYTSSTSIRPSRWSY